MTPRPSGTKAGFGGRAGAPRASSSKPPADHFVPARRARACRLTQMGPKVGARLHQARSLKAGPVRWTEWGAADAGRRPRAWASSAGWLAGPASLWRAIRDVVFARDPAAPLRAWPPSHSASSLAGLNADEPRRAELERAHRGERQHRRQANARPSPRGRRRRQARGAQARRAPRSPVEMLAPCAPGGSQLEITLECLQTVPGRAKLASLGAQLGRRPRAK